MRNRSIVSNPRVGGGLFVLLLAGCAGDEDTAQRVASTESELAATHASWVSARSEARACFESFGGCERGASRGSAACRDQLKACLPAHAPRPAGCSETGAGSESADTLAGFPGGGSEKKGKWWPPKDKDCDAGVPGGTGTPGGSGMPGGATGATGGPGGSGMPGGTMGGMTPPVEPPPVEPPPVEPPPVDEPPVDEPPVDEPPVDEPPVDEPPVVLELAAQDICQAPTLRPGALSGCGSLAANDLAGGAATAEASRRTLGCIAKNFKQRIAKVCTKATDLCSVLAAPVQACERLTQACVTLDAGD
jgi:hypothetical protein